MIAYDKLLVQFKQLLKSNNLKFTKQRELILKCLYENDAHFTPEEIHRLLQEKYPDTSIGIATVYRTLAVMEESGIASSISFGMQGKRYELGLKKHHDHLICTSCGKIIEFYDETIERRQKEIADAFNFQMHDHTMKIVGLCQMCQNESSGSNNAG